MPLSLIGIVLTMAGALALYASAPNQKLMSSRGNARIRKWSGAVLLATGLVALLNWAGPATAVFIWSTMALLIWSFVPVSAAYLRAQKSNPGKGPKA